MGVKDLWKVLEPARSSCSLADLKGKTLAVDLSGWIVESEALTSPGQLRIAKPHLKNLFYRACHMLRNGIRPVFIMDGAMAPALKQGTLERRKEQQARSRERAEGFSSPARQKSQGNKLPSTPTTPRRTAKQIAESLKSPSTPRSSRSFQHTVQECCELLDLMGLPHIQAEGEAEATCALLNKQGLVDGVITNDGDALVYGAQVVYKNFTCDEKKTDPMDMYNMEDIAAKLRLDQTKLIALAVLLGCDYYEGVKKVGKETAVQFLKTKDMGDVLERMKEWSMNKEKFEELEKSIPKKKAHCGHCGHLGALKQHKSGGCNMCKTKSNCLFASPEETKFCECEWHAHPQWRYLVAEVKIRGQAAMEEDFPPQQVIDIFLSPPAAPADVPVVWKEPQLEKLKSTLLEKLYFTEDRANSHLVPFIASYVLADWRENAHSDHIQPTRIVKARTKNFKPVFEVEWQVTGSQLTLGEGCTPHTTMEEQAAFRLHYPSLVEKFEAEEDLRLSQRKSRSKKKLPMPDSSQKKISDIFKSKRSATDTPRSSKKAASATALDVPPSTTSSAQDTKLIIKEVVSLAVPQEGQSSASMPSSGKSTPTISPTRSPSWTKGRFSRSCSFTSTTSRSRSRSPGLRTVTPDSRSSSRTSTPSRSSSSGKKRTPIRARPYLPKEFAQRVIRVDKRTKFRKRVNKEEGENFAKIRKRLFPEPSSIRKRLNFGGVDRSLMDESLEVEMSGLDHSDDEDDLGVSALPDLDTVDSDNSHVSRRSSRQIATSAFYGSPDRLSSRMSRSASVASMDSLVDDTSSQATSRSSTPQKRKSPRTPRKSASSDSVPLIVIEDSPKKKTPTKKTAPSPRRSTSRKTLPVKQSGSDCSEDIIELPSSLKRPASTSTPLIDLTDEEKPPSSKRQAKEPGVSSKGKASAKSSSKKGSGMKKSIKRRLLMSDEKTPSVKKFFTSLRT